MEERDHYDGPDAISAGAVKTPEFRVGRIKELLLQLIVKFYPDHFSEGVTEVYNS